jgi:serine/threonine-protein kinase
VDVTGDQSATRPGTDSDALLRGRQLGDFVLRELIGEGAFAAVYRCEQPLLGREAVVKVLHQRLRDSEVMFQRFMREARLASRLDHPYAAHVYAFGVEPDDGLAWIAMELVHGTSLARWITERGPLPLDMLVAFFEQVAEIVQNAHDHGIVHRDLKPSNVMIMEYAGKIFPKLLDFGIAKLVDQAALARRGSAVELEDTISSESTDSGNVNLTQADATLGSPPYMSPEQWCDPLSVGPRSDLYSLGAMAYEALTGHQPFTGDTIAAIGEQHCNADIPLVGGAFPAALDRMFRRALAKNPDDRPASALAFARELRVAAFPRAGADGPGNATEPQFALSRRRMWPLAAAAVALVAGATTLYVRSATSRTAVAGDAAVADPQKQAPPAAQANKLDLVPAASNQPAGGAAAQGAATITVDISSVPPGAEVFRIPSDTKVGVTPWNARLGREDAAQVFMLRKGGFAEQKVEVDLRTGGAYTVKLPRLTHRPAQPPAPSPSPRAAPTRREGEPVDPFRSGGS